MVGNTQDSGNNITTKSQVVNGRDDGLLAGKASLSPINWKAPLPERSAKMDSIGESLPNQSEDRFRHFEYLVVRFVLAMLLVLGAIKITVPLIIEVWRLLVM